MKFLKNLLLTALLATVSGFTGCTKKCEHANAKLISNTATCTNGGVETYFCYDCDKEISYESKPLGHDFSVLLKDTATCQSAGKKIYRCSRCNSTTETSSPKANHEYDGCKCSFCGQLIDDCESVSMTTTAKYTKSCHVYNSNYSEIAVVYVSFELSANSKTGKMSAAGIIYASSFYNITIYKSSGPQIGSGGLGFVGYSSSARSLNREITLSSSIPANSTFYISVTATAF